jgi:hypothetical protein
MRISWATRMFSVSSCPVCLTSSFILFTHQHLNFPSDLFLSLFHFWIFYAFIVCFPCLLLVSVTSLSLIWTPWITNYVAWHSEIFYSFPARPDDSYINIYYLPDFRKLGFTTLKKNECCVTSYLGVVSSMTALPVSLPPATVSGSDWKRRWNSRAIARRETAPSPVIDPYNTAFSNYITCLLIRSSWCALYKLRLVPEKRHIKCVTLLL